jgi:aminoglycoside phosphotransferase (APT) family kinase protein
LTRPHTDNRRTTEIAPPREGISLDALTQWAQQHSCPGARVAAVAPMPGNAGLSFGFDVVDCARRRYVVRLAPPGVRRGRNTDVLRQVPLIRCLAEEGVPVARVVWASENEQPFGTDAFIQEFVNGRPLHLTDPALSVRVPSGSDGMLATAVAALAQIHALGVPESLREWDRPRTVAEEIGFWEAMTPKVTEPAWRSNAERAATALKASAPTEVATGLVHGDFQTNNVLFASDGALVAIVDWELAGIGPQLLDVGWLCMFSDPTCWEDRRASAMRVRADREWIAERYRQGVPGSAPLRDLAWFQGLAAYRFGVIAAYNVKLHRTGKRRDEAWEEVAPSINVLFRRAFELSRQG